MTYIKVGETTYPAINHISIPHDAAWDRRDARQFTLNMSFASAMEIFQNDVEWSLVRLRYAKDANGEIQTITDIDDCGEYSIAGPITDNRNGTVTVKMGKPTDGELLAIIMGGN